MVFKFQQWQIEELQRLKNNPVSADGPYPFSKAYELMAQWGNGGVVVDPNSIIWLKVASKVNKNEGVFSDFIRNYTSAQHELRYGLPLNNAQLQALSDDIARNVIDTATIDNHIIANRADIPSITQIGQNDAERVIVDHFHNDITAWSGVLLFPFLGDRSYLDNLVAESDETSTYQAISVISAALRATGAGGISGAVSILANALTLIGAANAGATTLYVADKLTSFVNDAYGVNTYTTLVSRTILGKMSMSDGHGLNDTIISDANTLEMIHTGEGDDTVIARNIGDVGDVVDGGEGDDIFDFSTATFDMDVTSDTESYTNSRLLLEATYLPIDYSVLVNIETLKLGEGDDTVDITLSAASSLQTLSTGAGDDEVTINGDTPVNVELGEGDDTFFSKDLRVVARVDGGAGDDTLDFSKASALNGSLNSQSLINIETLRLSKQNDSIHVFGGTALTIYGEDGSDIISTGINRDIVLGGTGKDTVTYNSLNRSITLSAVALADAHDGEAGVELNAGGNDIDRAIDVEKVELTAYADTLRVPEHKERLGFNVLFDGGGAANDNVALQEKAA